MSSSISLNIFYFCLAASMILFAGSKIAGVADRIADRTGLGEALTGTLLLGFTTSLPGIAASVKAAIDSYPELALSSAIGGIAVQTTFLAIADIAYRKANLEHAAAAMPNMMQTIVLITLMSLVVLIISGPPIMVGFIHAGTLLLFAAAGFGFHLMSRTQTQPMWYPKRTRETVIDEPEPGAQQEHLPKLIAIFLVTAAIVLGGGVIATESAARIADETGISQTVVGGFMLGIVTSLPELVTTVAAVRRGAITLAVSGIVGGNVFDVLFVCLADIAYLEGSIYHAPGIGRNEIFLIMLAILLNAIFLMGLLYRQKRGPANIGFESVLMLCIYLAGFLMLSLTPNL